MAMTQLGEAVKSTNMPLAQSYVEEALETFRGLGSSVEVGMALRQLGLFAHHEGKYEQATAYHTESLALWRALDHPWGVPAALRELADDALALGRLDDAERQYRESLVRWRALGERMHMSDCLFGLVRVSLASKDAARAAMLLGAKDSLDESMGYFPARESLAEVVQQVRNALGESVFAEQWELGRARALEDVLDEITADVVDTGGWDDPWPGAL